MDIELRPDLRETLEEDAAREAKSVSDVVNDAVERYLRERQLARLDAEVEAYERMHPQLKQKYFGQWVAVHNQELVDHDNDHAALYQRVRDKYGRAAVLIRQVMEQPTREIRIRTPSRGKIE